MWCFCVELSWRNVYLFLCHQSDKIYLFLLFEKQREKKEESGGECITEFCHSILGASSKNPKVSLRLCPMTLLGNLCCSLPELLMLHMFGVLGLLLYQSLSASFIMWYSACLGFCFIGHFLSLLLSLPTPLLLH